MSLWEYVVDLLVLAGLFLIVVVAFYLQGVFDNVGRN